MGWVGWEGWEGCMEAGIPGGGKAWRYRGGEGRNEHLDM